MLSDLRFGARMLLRTPATSLAATLALALGIGANTTIFSVLYGVLLRPLPYPRAERLVLIWQDLRQRGGPPDEWATWFDYTTWRAESSVFAAVAAAAGAATRAAAAALLLAAAAVACWAPARRATRIDPVEALRYQ